MKIYANPKKSPSNNFFRQIIRHLLNKIFSLPLFISKKPQEKITPLSLHRLFPEPQKSYPSHTVYKEVALPTQKTPRIPQKNHWPSNIFPISNTCCSLVGSPKENSLVNDLVKERDKFRENYYEDLSPLAQHFDPPSRFWNELFLTPKLTKVFLEDILVFQQQPLLAQLAFSSFLGKHLPHDVTPISKQEELFFRVKYAVLGEQYDYLKQLMYSYDK